MLRFYANSIHLLKPLHYTKVRHLGKLSRLTSIRFSSNYRQPVSANILTVPNVLTISRIACTPFIGYSIMTNDLTPALCLFAYSCITDFLDGFIARKWHSKSVAGTILDPIADKLLMIVTTVSLAFSPGPQIIPMSIAGLILGRDMLLGISALFVRYTSMKRKYGSITWNSFWDFFHFPSAEVKPTKVSKYNTFFQMIYLGCGVLLLMLRELKEGNEQEEHGEVYETLSQGFTWLGYLVGTTTCLSGASYVFSKNAVKFL
ncbi:CRD1 (YDL142C) [Zygosaccharomyces parabailii]|nr:CRD1 (YDL142C) [Zygosaccharomyces parabailii]CDH08720.1 related to Cardiolipin synthase [Zygosaccharomyces bailii ISA1307]